MAAPAIPAGATQTTANVGTKQSPLTLIGPQPDPTRSMQALARAVQQTQNHPVLSGKLVSISIPANAVSVTLNHGLGYKPSGCFVAMTAQPLLITMPGGEADQTKTLNLAVNAGGFTASFWVW
jgi:hypothetical protein